MVFDKKVNRLLTVIFFAFLVRLSLIPFFYNQPLNIVDEQHYNSLSLSLLERGEFGWKPGRLTAIRPPLYPAFIYIIYKIFGPNNYNAVRLLQLFLSLASGCLVYSLAKKIFREEKAALFACILFLFYPSLVLFNYLILTETLFIFLFLLAFGFWSWG